MVVVAADPDQVAVRFEFGDGDREKIPRAARRWFQIDRHPGRGEDGSCRIAVDDQFAVLAGAVDGQAAAVDHRAAGEPAAHQIESGDPGGKAGAWVLQHLVGGPGFGDPALLEHDDPLRKQQGIEQVVGHQHRRLVGQHLPQNPAQQRGHRHIEGGHRLVQQQQLRLCGQRPGDRHPLSLAAGELAGPPSGELGHPHLIQPVLGVCVGRLPAHPGDPRAEGDVLDHAEMREQQRILSQQ